MESKKGKVELDTVGVDALSNVLGFLDVKDRLAARQVSKTWREAYSSVPGPMSSLLSEGIQATPGQRLVAAAKAWAKKQEVTREDVRNYISNHEREVCSMLTGGFVDCKDPYDITLPPSFPEEHRTFSMNCQLHCSKTRIGKRLLHVFLKWFELPPYKTLEMTLYGQKLYPVYFEIKHFPKDGWYVQMELYHLIIEGLPESAYEDTERLLDRLFPEVQRKPGLRRRTMELPEIVDLIGKIIRSPVFDISSIKFKFAVLGSEFSLYDMEKRLGIS